MKATWKSSKYPGVRYYEHPSRTTGRGGKKRRDRYFSIRYQTYQVQNDGKVVKKRKEEGLGWLSEGWTEAQAATEREKLKNANKTGEGPRTRKETAELNIRQQATQKAAEITVADFWPTYLNHLKNRLQKVTSWRQEVNHYDRRIKPLFGDKPLKNITTADVEKMVAMMKADGLAPRTQKYAVGTLYRIWKFAARNKIVRADDNPAKDIAIETTNNTRQRVLTPDELKEILERLATSDPAAHDITLFCAFTGCRFSEAAKLTWDRVNLETNEAKFTDTKNHEDRTAYLVPQVLDMLKGKQKKDGLVFVRKDGQPYRQPPHPFATAVENLKLNEGRGTYNKVTFHTLRHTAATRAATKVNFKDMQVIFGWKTPAMVFRYAKGDEDTQRAAMDNIAQGITGETG